MTCWPTVGKHVAVEGDLYRHCSFIVNITTSSGDEAAHQRQQGANDGVHRRQQNLLQKSRAADGQYKQPGRYCILPRLCYCIDKAVYAPRRFRKGSS